MTRQCSVLKERMWRERLDRYHQSGVSVAALCAAEGVSLAAFYCWQRRLREVAGLECGPQVATPVGRDAAVRDHAALVVLVVVWAPEDEVWIEVPGSVVAASGRRFTHDLYRVAARTLISTKLTRQLIDLPRTSASSHILQIRVSAKRHRR